MEDNYINELLNADKKTLGYYDLYNRALLKVTDGDLPVIAFKGVLKTTTIKRSPRTLGIIRKVFLKASFEGTNIVFGKMTGRKAFEKKMRKLQNLTSSEFINRLVLIDP